MIGRLSEWVCFARVRVVVRVSVQKRVDFEEDESLQVGRRRRRSHPFNIQSKWSAAAGGTLAAALGIHSVSVGSDSTLVGQMLFKSVHMVAE